MEIGNALIRIHHGESGPVFKAGLDIGLNGGLGLCRKVLDPGEKITEAVVEVSSKLLKEGLMAGDEIPEVDPYAMTEDDRI